MCIFFKKRCSLLRTQQKQKQNRMKKNCDEIRDEGKLCVE